MRVAVSGDKAGHHIDALVIQILEGFLHQLCRQISVDHMLAQLLLRTDEVAGVHADTVLHHRGHDMRTQTLTIADDGILRLLRQVVNQIHTVEDALQLVEELVYIVK